MLWHSASKIVGHVGDVEDILLIISTSFGPEQFAIVGMYGVFAQVDNLFISVGAISPLLHKHVSASQEGQGGLFAGPSLVVSAHVSERRKVVCCSLELIGAKLQNVGLCRFLHVVRLLVGKHRCY